MDYNEFEIQDFLKDENFVLWVTNPTEDRSFFWNTWLSRHPHKLETILKAKELIGSVRPKNKRLPSEDEFLRVLENVMKNQNPNYGGSKYGKVINIRKVIIRWSVAASLLIGLLIGIISLKYNGLESIQANSGIQPTQISKITLPGQKLTRHTLPDGTVISLNADSKISYPEIFPMDKREVFLEGEAFFDVKRDVHRPFLIRANGSLTRVLGTSFNVNAYPSENIVEVAVLSGKVAVYPWKYEENVDNQEMLLLSPNEKATINTTSYEVMKVAADLETILSWKENLLIFQNERFNDVVKKLEKWYGVEFRVSPGTNTKGKWNGRFQNNSLEYVLKGLMFSSDVQFKIDEKIVYVTSKKPM